LPGLIDWHSEELKIVLDGIIKDLGIAGIDDADQDQIIAVIILPGIDSRF
jgi:hypothetical protein